MKMAVVYYRELEKWGTRNVLDEMRDRFAKHNWEFYGLYVDHPGEYENLMYLITEELRNVDVVYIYNLNNIGDDFYWELLNQSAKVENVLIKEFSAD